MKIRPTRFPLSPSIRPRGQWAAVLLTLLAAAASARADHFYSAFTQEFDRTSEQGQIARAIVTDSRGNVIVAGETLDSNQVSQWYVAKYDGLDGHRIGNAFILGPSNAGLSQTVPTGDSFVRSVAVDSEDNIIVAGGSTFGTNNEDFETIKLNPQLAQLWARSRNGSNSGADEVQKVAVDSHDNVYVTGFVADSGTGDDISTVIYNSGGGLLHQVQYNNSGNSDDVPTDLAVDPSSGNIWVVGSTTIAGNVSFVVLQYDNNLATIANFPKVFASPGLGFGASGVALDSAGSAFVTGTYTASDHSHGFYTTKFGTTGIQFWSDTYISSSGDFSAFANGIAVGPDDNPVVTGTADSGDGATEAVTIQYRGNSLVTGASNWVQIDPGLSPEDPNHAGFPEFNTNGRMVKVDGAGNVIVAGDSAGDENGLDIYVAKYSGVDGSRLFFSSFAGDFGSDDTGVAVATDAAGNIAIAGTEERNFNGTGRSGIVTQKYQRIAAETGDPLPIDTVTNKPRKISALNAPAIADNGDLAARITLAEGSTRLGAILTQGSEGGSQLPILQKAPAPNVPGFAMATFASFSDPVISPDGHYAFNAKLSGGVPASKANSLWTNLGGTLHLVLQQGTQVPGVSGTNVASVLSISLRDSQLLALVKVSGPAKANMMLLGINSGNVVTNLLRTDQTISVNGMSSTIKSMTVLAPSPNSAGDGRWQGDTHAVVKAVLADKRTVVFEITPTKVVTPIFFTGQDATAIAGSTDTWKTFGYPAVGTAGQDFATLGTLETTSTVKSTTESAMIYSSTGTTIALIGREGSAPGSNTDLANILYSAFSNPVTNASGNLAFLATLKAAPGGGVKVTSANNRALLFGAVGALETVARTGDKATDASGAPGAPTYSSFLSFALPTGTPGGPIFVAHVAGKGISSKNNLGVWALDSSGLVRQLLRTGEKLGTQTVTNITLLKSVPKAFAAARSFNNGGGVAMLVSFSDHSTGILELQVP